MDLLPKKHHTGSGSEPFVLLVVFLLMIATFGSWAFFLPTMRISAALDVPQLISFQGRLTNNNRITVPDGNQNIKFGIYSASSGGTCLWSAANTDANTATIDCPGNAPGGAVTVNVTDGIFYVLLGDTTASQNALPDSLFDNNATLFLGITVGSDAEMSPRVRLASSPYSMQSGNADLLDAFNSSQTGGNNIVAVTDGSGNLVLTGSVRVAGGQGISTSGAGALALGTSNATSISIGSGAVTATTFTTDGTGDAEIVLPTGSIGGGEILDNTINGVDLADTIVVDGSALTYSLGGGVGYQISTSADSTIPVTVGIITTSQTNANTGLDVNYSLVANGATQTQTASRVTISNNGTAGVDRLNALVLRKMDTGSNATGDVLLTLQNNETTANALADGLLVVSSSTNTDITDAIDVSTANILNAINVGSNVVFGTSATIDFSEFDVSGATGSVTIDDDGNAGSFTVEGTVLDIDSVDFIGAGSVVTTGSNVLTLSAGGGVSVVTSGTPADVLKSTTSGGGAGFHIIDTASSAQSAKSNSLLYLTQPDASNRYGIYIDTEETTQGQTVFAIESDTTNGSGADTFKFRIDASGEAFSDVGFSSGATTHFTDGVIHKEDPGTFSLYTYGSPGDDILLDDNTLVVQGYEDRVGIGTRDPGAQFGIASDEEDHEYIRLTGENDAVGIFSGVNTPTFQAEGGSLYLKSDNDGTQTPALYLNTSATDDGTSWIEIPVSSTTTVTNQTNYYSSGGGGSSPSDLSEAYTLDDDHTIVLAADGLTLDTTATDMTVAETYASTEVLVEGDVVVVDVANAQNVVKSAVTYASGLFGVVATAPALTLSDASAYAIARSGVVSVKVNDENGAVAIGDVLTSSSVAGEAMLSQQAGSILGYALEAFAGPGSGTILVALNPGWSAGAVVGTDGALSTWTGDLAFAATGTADAITTTYDSFGLSLRGSAWDGDSAETVALTLQNVVTDSTDYRLSIRDTADAEIAYITADGSFAATADVIVGGHLYPSDRGTVQTAKYIYYDGSEGFGGDTMRTNASAWGTGSYDFAEMFPSTETLESGDVVVFGDVNESIEKSSGSYDAKLAGIISTRPGFLAGNTIEGHYPVALAGRVPTKVTTEGGDIAIGDPLTSSSTNGYAMKATEPGPIVGYALEPYDGESETNTIVVFVNVSYWGGDATDEVPGTSSSASGLLSGNLASLNMNGNIYMGGNEIVSIGTLRGLSDTWSVDENGLFATTGSYDVTVESYQGDEVTAHAMLSREQLVTLSGSAQLDGGRATITFEEVDPLFNDITSTYADIRVLVTPRGPSNGIFVAEADHNGFTVEENFAGQSYVAFDWFVEAYRKDYEPEEEAVEEPVVEVEEIVADETVVEDEPIPNTVTTDPTDPAVEDTTTTDNNDVESGEELTPPVDEPVETPPAE
jgi:hypothetical protein